MIKKIVIGSAVALVAGWFFFGKGLFSYARTAANELRESVRGEVPLEFEVKRAREEVEALVPDIKKCMQLVAEQQVNIDHLKESIRQKTAGLDKQKEAMYVLRKHLDGGAGMFVSYGREYSQDEVSRDLSRKLQRYEAAESSVSQEQKILAAHQQMLVANEQKLNAMLAAKRDLEVQIAQLEARVKTVEAAEAASELVFDDSQLARAKQLISSLNKQLDVRAAMLEAEGRMTDGIPVLTEPEDEAPVDITERFDAKFGGETNIDAASLKPAA